MGTFDIKPYDARETLRVAALHRSAIRETFSFLFFFFFFCLNKTLFTLRIVQDSAKNDKLQLL